MAYSISWEKRGACITYLGRVTFEEFMGAIMSVHCSPDYASLKYVIHDMSATDKLDFSGVDMTTIVSHELGARYTNPHIRAAVVSSDPKMGEFTRRFSTITHLGVGLFTTLPQARAWTEQSGPATGPTD